MNNTHMHGVRILNTYAVILMNQIPFYMLSYVCEYASVCVGGCGECTQTCVGVHLRVCVCVCVCVCVFVCVWACASVCMCTKYLGV